MQVEIKDYLNALIKRWWIIAIVVIGAAAAGFIYSKAQTPVYEVSSSLEAIPGITDNGLIIAIKADLPRHASLLQSRDFLLRVLANNQGSLDDLSVDDIHLKTQPLPDNMQIQMTVDDTNADRAAALTNAIAREFILEKAAEQQANPQTNKVIFQQPDRARPPDRPSLPRTTLNTAAAALLGLVLGVLLLILIEFFDNTLKTSDDVQRYLELNTIGMIPAQNRR